jgi:hypothetical protein
VQRTRVYSVEIGFPTQKIIIKEEEEDVRQIYYLTICSCDMAIIFFLTTKPWPEYNIERCKKSIY